MHKSHESAAPRLRAFLCLFDVQLQTLVIFEGINIFFNFWKKGIEVFFSSFNFFFTTLSRSFLGLMAEV